MQCKCRGTPSPAMGTPSSMAVTCLTRLRLAYGPIGWVGVRLGMAAVATIHPLILQTTRLSHQLVNFRLSTSSCSFLRLRLFSHRYIDIRLLHFVSLSPLLCATFLALHISLRLWLCRYQLPNPVSRTIQNADGFGGTFAISRPWQHASSSDSCRESRFLLCDTAYDFQGQPAYTSQRLEAPRQRLPCG